MRASSSLIEKTLALMHTYGFKARTVQAPTIRITTQKHAYYDNGVVYLGTGCGDYDLVHEIVHHYQHDQKIPPYVELEGESYYRSWSSDPRETEARVVSLAFIKPLWTPNEVILYVQAQTQRIQNGDYSDIKGA
jgi:hypothetical protein